LLQETDTVFNKKQPIPLSQIVNKKQGADASVGGGMDDGDPSDDKIAGKKMSISVAKLKPAQTEIIKEKAFGMAIGLLLKGQWNNADLGAIISNDNYIMDGHHRWAATYLIDPKAKVQGTVIDLPGGPLITALNVITVGKLGITTGNKGKGNVADFTGANLAKVIDNAMANGLKGEFPIKPEDVKKALGNMPNANGNAEVGKQLMIKNADAMPKQIMPGAPARVNMPVIDGSKVAMVQKMLEKGLIDLEPPYTAKVKTAFDLKENKIMKKTNTKQSAYTSKTQRLEEELVRLLVRKQLREAEEDNQKETEPEKAKDEPGLEPDLAEITDLYIKKLKNAQSSVDQSDVVEIIGQLLDSFGYGNQDKLTILQGVKQTTIR